MSRQTLNEADSNALSFGLIILALLVLGAIIELLLPAPRAEEVFAHHAAGDVTEVVSEIADDFAE